MSRLLSAALLLSLAACGARTGLEVDECPDGATCCAASAEVCNSRDDDCDGAIDEGEVCCVPSPEVCNDLDDDCDGLADDGLVCFTLDGAPIRATPSERCGVDWYSYNTPDAESANPTPDIRESGGVVVAVVYGAACDAASVGVIADLPMDGSGGELQAQMVVDPPGAAVLGVGDEPRECVFDDAAGVGSCSFTWQPCCTDGFLIDGIRGDACVTITLGAPMAGVTGVAFLDGVRRVPLAFDRAFEVCARFRPAI